MLKNLFDAVGDKFTLISFGDPDCPVECLAAIPREDAVSGPRWLPPAARPAARRAAVGRGVCRQSAALSCLGEAAELVSSCAWGDECVVRARSDELTKPVVELGELLLVSDRQYTRRDSWNAEYADICQLPGRGDVDQPQDWLEAIRLGTGDTRLVPAPYALIGYGDEHGEARTYAGTSNGCAAGETREHAILSGFLELVERDATAIWWYGGHQRPAIDLTDFPGLAGMVDWLSRDGRLCQVLDISTDLAIPVCAAVSANADGSQVALGFAAHFSGEVAIRSALSEVCQQVLAQRFRDDAATQPGHLDQWWRSVINTATVPHLLARGTISPTALPQCQPASSLLDYCCDLCAAHQLEPLVIDLTRPSLGIPVVRVVVPGLRHTLPNFAAGRMYDVAAKLDWERRPTEDDMTPFPLIG